MVEEEKARQEKMQIEKMRMVKEEKASHHKLEQEREIELAKLAHAKEIAEMQLQAGQKNSFSSQPTQHHDHTYFNVVHWFHAVPKFRENAIEDCFVSFEKMSHRLKWPYEYCTTLLQNVLIGKALEV